MVELTQNIPDEPIRVQKATPKASPKKVVAVGLPKTLCIILEENDNISPGGQFFGLNGVGYMLRPGEQVNIPMGLVEILDNAVEDRPVQDPLTKRIIGYRKRLRYPYRVVREDQAA